MTSDNLSLRKVLGDKTFSAIQKCRVLMVTSIAAQLTHIKVGAGGIGCELIKNLVLTGFVNIDVVDLDTIDLSNLNRQFLFQKKHIKMSKAEVAKETVLKFNPNAKINAYFGSIYEEKFTIEWFKSFDIILNALDNIKARRYVNMMAAAGDIPLIESGTAGYLGQVSVHKKGVFECYDCAPKPTQKTFPVCTIRSTPSEPIHCIVWAKSYLFNILFGKDDEDEEEGMNEEGADQKELDDLKEEARALKILKEKRGSPDFAELVFKKVFENDINRLLKMEDMWKEKKKPVPLVYSKISSPKSLPDAMAREQNVWSLEHSKKVFCESLEELCKEFKELREGDAVAGMTFDKDHEIGLDFVTAASNFRAHVFNIKKDSRFTVKEIAGNIIPAIATTNAIIAGMIVIQAINVVKGDLSKCMSTELIYSVRSDGTPVQHLLSSGLPKPPAPSCEICSATYLFVTTDTKTTTLRQLIDGVVLEKKSSGGLGLNGDEVSVRVGEGMIYDPDFDDNEEKVLSDLKLGNMAKCDILAEDDDGRSFSIVIFLTHKDGNAGVLKISGDAVLNARPLKRKADDEEEEEQGVAGPSAKKMKVTGKDSIVYTVDDSDAILID